MHLVLMTLIQLFNLDTRRGRRAGHRLGVDNGKKGER